MIFGITKARKEMLAKLNDGAAILLVKASRSAPSDKYGNWYILTLPTQTSHESADRRAVEWLLDHGLIVNVHKNQFDRKFIISSKGKEIAQKLKEKNEHVSQSNPSRRSS